MARLPFLLLTSLTIVAVAAPAVADPAPPAPEGPPTAGPGDAAKEAAKDEAPPTVTLGKARMAKGGALPKGTDAALRAITPKITACYEEAILLGHEGEPRLDLRLELVGPGVVAAADVTSSVEASSALRGCVRDAFAGAPAGGVGPDPVEVLLGIEMQRTVPDDLVLSPSACKATCDGELDEATVRAVRARAQAAAFCFKKAAAAGEPAQLKGGQATVTLRIAEDGSVCGVGIGGDPWGRPSLTSCIMRELEKPLAAGPTGCAEASFPLVYKGT